jgi:hypothetical protein
MSDFNPQNFSIEKLNLVTSSGANIDIRSMVVEFNYFEDIFGNSTSGSVILSNSLNLDVNYTWNGSEYLILSLSKGEYNIFSTEHLNKIFRIYNMDGKRLTKDTNENLILNFCSEEFLISQQYKINKSYKNMKIVDMVKDIAFNYLKIPKKEFTNSNAFDTRGTYDIVIPNLMPLEAINWLCTFAISSDPKIIGSTFLFFQDRFGWNFKPLLAIYGDYEVYNKRGKIYNTYWYGTKNDGSQTGDTVDFKSIISYQVLNSYDSCDYVTDGTFANKAITVNYITRKHGVATFEYDSYFNKLKQLSLYKQQPYGLTNGFTNRFNHKYSDTVDSFVKCIYSTTDLEKNAYIKKNTPAIKNNYLEQCVQYRFAQMKLISSIRVKIAIPGDPYITVGDVIYLYLKAPGPESIGSDLKKKEDKIYSGIYLVTAIRHRFNQDNDFDTTIELCKDSFISSVEGYNTSGLDTATNTSYMNTVKTSGVF